MNCNVNGLDIEDALQEGILRRYEKAETALSRARDEQNIFNLQLANLLT